MSLPAAAGIEGSPWLQVEVRVGGIVAHAQTLIDVSTAGLRPADVHALRVACKRLRALWRMLEPGFGPGVTRPAERALRDAARELAGQRQAWVLVKSLESLQHKADRRQDRVLAADLAGRLTEALGAEAAVATPGPLLRGVFGQQLPALAALPGGPPSVEDLLAGILHGAQRARKLGRRAGRRGEAVLWHRCRRWVKYEHYQLELALRPNGVLRQRHRRLERLGVLLGRHQDGYDLERQLGGGEMAATLPAPAAAALAAWRADRDTGRLLKCVRRRQQRLLRRIEKRFEVLYDGGRGGFEAALRAALVRT